MTAAANVQLVVLFEDELRKAAKLLEQFYAAAEETPDEDISRMASDALQACRVALYHEQLLRDGAIVMLTGSRLTFGATAPARGD